jgi:hypothetical protein
MPKTLDQYEEERIVLVRDRAAGLYANEYSPLIKENFEEFLRELVEDEECVTMLFEYSNQYSRCKENSQLLGVGLTLTMHLNEYWKKRAILHAEADIPSAVDVMGDERGSGRCNGR